MIRSYFLSQLKRLSVLAIVTIISSGCSPHERSESISTSRDYAKRNLVTLAKYKERVKDSAEIKWENEALCPNREVLIGHYNAYYDQVENIICIKRKTILFEPDLFEAMLAHEVVHLVQDCITPNSFFGLSSHEIGPIGEKLNIRPQPISMNPWKKNRWSKLWTNIDFNNLSIIQQEAFGLQEHPETVLNEVYDVICKKNNGVPIRSIENDAKYRKYRDIYVPVGIACNKAEAFAYQTGKSSYEVIKPSESIYKKFNLERMPEKNRHRITAPFVIVIKGKEYEAKGYSYGWLVHQIVVGGGHQMSSLQGGIQLTTYPVKDINQDPMGFKGYPGDLLCSNSKYDKETEGFIYFY